MNTFIHQLCIELLKRNIKYIYIVKKRFLFQINVELFSTLIILRNVLLAPNQHIRRISKGSCDTKDWSNDAENSALTSQEIYYILKYMKIDISYFKL